MWPYIILLIIVFGFIGYAIYTTIKPWNKEFERQAKENELWWEKQKLKRDTDVRENDK